MCGLEVGQVGIAATSSQCDDVVDSISSRVAADVADVGDSEDLGVASL